MKVPVDSDYTYCDDIVPHWYGQINKFQEAHLFSDYAGHSWRFCKCNPTVVPVFKIDAFTKYETLVGAIYLHNALVTAPIPVTRELPIKTKPYSELTKQRVRKRSNPRSALTEEIQRLKDQHNG